MAAQKLTKEMNLILEAFQWSISTKENRVHLLAKERKKYINMVEMALKRDKPPAFVDKRMAWLDKATKEWAEAVESHELLQKLHKVATEGDPEKCQWMCTSISRYIAGKQLVCFFSDIDGYTGFLSERGLWDGIPEGLKADNEIEEAVGDSDE